MKRVISYPMVLFFMFIVIINPLTVCGIGELPPILSWHMSTDKPDITNNLEISIQWDTEMNDGTEWWPLIGVVNAYLFWSRDGSSYISEPMAMLTTLNYIANIPRQDGYDDVRFYHGAGQFFWYALLTNDHGAESNCFSAQNPNIDVVYQDMAGTYSYSISTTEEPVENIEDEIGNVIGGFVSEGSAFIGQNTLLFVLIVSFVILAIISFPPSRKMIEKFVKIFKNI